MSLSTVRTGSALSRLPRARPIRTASTKNKQPNHAWLATTWLEVKPAA